MLDTTRPDHSEAYPLYLAGVSYVRMQFRIVWVINLPLTLPQLGARVYFNPPGNLQRGPNDSSMAWNKIAVQFVSDNGAWSVLNEGKLTMNSKILRCHLRHFDCFRVPERKPPFGRDTTEGAAIHGTL